MKKLMSLMLGLAFIAGSVTVVLADDAAKDTTKTTVTKKVTKATKARPKQRRPRRREISTGCNKSRVAASTSCRGSSCLGSIRT